MILGVFIVLTSIIAFTTSLNVFFKIIQIVVLWILVLYLIPLLILYFNYSKVNKNNVFIFDKESIIFNDGVNKNNFKLEDIECIELNLSIPLYNKRYRLFFWDEYFYALLKLKNGKKLYITCLLCDELEKFIPKHLFKRKERIFPLISKE